MQCKNQLGASWLSATESEVNIKTLDNIQFLNHMREAEQETRGAPHDSDASAHWGELLDELTRRGFTLEDL